MEEVNTAHPSKVCDVSKCGISPLPETCWSLLLSFLQQQCSSAALLLLLPFLKIPSAKWHHMALLVCFPALYLFSFFHLLSLRVTFESINCFEVDHLCTLCIASYTAAADAAVSTAQLCRPEGCTCLCETCFTHCSSMCLPATSFVPHCRFHSIPPSLENLLCFPIVNSIVASPIGHVYQKRPRIHSDRLKSS